MTTFSKEVKYGIYITGIGYVSNVDPRNVTRGNTFDEVLTTRTKQLPKHTIILLMLCFVSELKLSGYEVMGLSHPIIESDIRICEITTRASNRVNPAGNGHSITTTTSTEILSYEECVELALQMYKTEKELSPNDDWPYSHLTISLTFLNWI